MARIKHKKNKGRFAGVPDVVMNHPDYYERSFSAKALLFEFALQYRGNNNGKLCAVHSQLKERGWSSDTTLRNNIGELIGANLIVKTKHGLYGAGKRLPNYYAITWQPIDDIAGFDMEIKSTVVPIRAFSVELKVVGKKHAA
ncbi:hypothetical protein [Aliiglaciecola sp. M165]|uniref:hypothetical protein n=1 Tax=Aliiglaciecola sp. M165 TaxID=2593649 RepID=UPI001180020A|nr:hypothetical protein [Aliiglaciecola sp. M165]TRY30728.1 hypothetical protein FM019_12620 [Aliiglaciecola sp. M165]